MIQFLPIANHLVEHRLGIKDRSFVTTKFDMCPTVQVVDPQELGVEFRSPASVEPLAEFRNQMGRPLNEEEPVAHDLLIISPDVEFTADDIDMCGGCPL